PTPDKVRETLLISLSLLADSEALPVASLTEIREMLEVPAAELAAVRGTDEDLQQIKNAIFDHRTMSANDVFACSQQFHIAIHRAAHNPLLELLGEPIIL